jgi:hypothetical protein
MILADPLWALIYGVELPRARKNLDQCTKWKRREINLAFNVVMTADNKHRFAITCSSEFYYGSNSISSNTAPPLQNILFSLEKRGFEDDSGDSGGGVCVEGRQ